MNSTHKFLTTALVRRMLLTAMLMALGPLVGCQSKTDTSEVPSAGASSISQGATDKSAVLATIDGVEIHAQEFQDRINSQTPYVRARYTSNEQKREFLDSLIRFEVLAMQAKEEGFDKDPSVILAMKRLMVQKLMKEQLDKGISPQDIRDEEMKAAYEAQHDEFNMPEEIRVSAIILASNSEAQSVATLALGEQGKSNKGFRELVAVHSTDKESSERGGDLRYFTKTNSEIPAPVVSAAFTLKKTGDVAGPIASEDGRYYIIKQTGHRKAIHKSYEDVKRQLQNRVYREKRTQAQKDFVQELRAKAKIEINEEVLRGVTISPSAQPNARDPHANMPKPPGQRENVVEATP